MTDSVISSAKTVEFVTDLLGPGMHFKRARAIGKAVVGVMHADRLSSAAVGREVARRFGLTPKSGIKHVDRLLGNSKFHVKEAFRQTVPFLVAGRKEIVVSLDWTEYPADGHSRIAINLVTKHGRATPLVWHTVRSSKLKWRRNQHEDELLRLLAIALPDGVNVVVLADRGFGDVKLYRYLRETLGWDFVIRFRGAIQVETAEGVETTAANLVPTHGRARGIDGALVTAARFPISVVCVKARKMKDAWCLATTLEAQADRVVKLYGRRFTCEECFRDEKDRRFGYGFKDATVTTPERRDRFLFIAMIATMILTILGAAGEELGYDRHLKANTVKRRSHSLLRQGREYLTGCAQRFRSQLRATYLKLLLAHSRETTMFGFL